MLGNKQFELSNLPIAIGIGNVLTTVSDRKIPHTSDNITIDYYTSDITSAQDYYAFGMLMPGRNFSSDNYKFGFNGQEKDDEISGSGNIYTAEYWEYDSRLGRRWNCDPKPNASISDYACFANNPIWFNDPLGDTVKVQGDVNIGPPTEFVYNTKNALNDISKKSFGKASLDELQNSPNLFTIKETDASHPNSSFVPSNVLKAYAQENKEQGNNIPDDMLKGGSGGTIYWNPIEGAEKTFESPGLQTSRPKINLGHELFGHALDANRGTMNDIIYKGLSTNEWQASHKENQLRSELGFPLRKYYGTAILKNLTSGEVISEQGIYKLIRGTRSTFVKNYDYKINNSSFK
ncbi:MAG TPA: M91 family zinc metallopeptidase [Bacteroidales bacterium]|nr:M91 family zinc metallopeptidase [Bacteroidales bacterium]